MLAGAHLNRVACKLTFNVKEGVIQEALVETVGCSGMTHSAAMASEILVGKTILEAINTDFVCDAINTAMRELFLQIVYGRTQTAFSEDGLPIGAGLEDLGKGLAQSGWYYLCNTWQKVRDIWNLQRAILLSVPLIESGHYYWLQVRSPRQDDGNG